MARPLRIEFDGALYHVTARGNERQAMVRDEQDRNRWLEELARVVERYQLELFSFALLDNHYHLFLETPHGGLSGAMQTLNGSYAAYFNRRHHRVGHLFQGRFQAILIEREGHYAELSRYIHLNPVRAGLVERPEEYRWSSFRGYVRAEWVLEWVNYERVLAEHGSDLRKARSAYREFVEEGLGGQIVSPLQEVVQGCLLGGKRFVEEVRKKIAGREEDVAIPQIRALRPRPGKETIVAEVADWYQLTWDELMRAGRGRKEARDVALYLVRELTGARLQEIGEFFGGLSAASVSLRASAIREAVAQDPSLSDRVRRIRERILEQKVKL